MVNERCVSEAKKQKKRELCIYSLRWQTGLHQPHEREAYVYDINSCDQTHDVGGGGWQWHTFLEFIYIMLMTWIIHHC